jgi:L-malate glycosyltransferase
MKVLHILGSCSPGGAEILTLDVCKNSLRFGLTIILLIEKSGPLEKEFIKTGVKVIRIPRKGIDPFFIIKLHRLILKEKIEIVHTHQAIDAFHSFSASYRLNVKIVLTHHGYEKNYKTDLILKLIIKKLHSNLFVSKSFCEDFIRLSKIPFNPNFHILYNGVDKERLTSLEGLCNFRKELGLNSNNILLGMIGNFYYEVRDQLTVCKALSKILPYYSDVFFVFVGARSSNRSELFDNCVSYCKKNNIGDKVFFVGSRTDIANILCDLNIFVFSSLGDTFGISIIEAMMKGVPCVISNIPVFSEISEQGKYAITFEAKSYEDLSKKLIFLIENADQRKLLANQAQVWASNVFNIENHIMQLVKIYRN